MKTQITLLIATVLVFSFTFTTLAADEVNQGQQDNLESMKEEAGILPGENLYFVDDMLEETNIVIANNNGEEVQVMVDQITETVAEAKVLMQEGKREKAVEVAMKAIENQNKLLAKDSELDHLVEIERIHKVYGDYSLIPKLEHQFEQLSELASRLQDESLIHLLERNYEFLDNLVELNSSLSYASEIDLQLEIDQMEALLLNEIQTGSYSSGAATIAE